MKNTIIFLLGLLFICSNNVNAGEFVIKGKPERVDLVATYVVSQGHKATKQPGDEVKGELNGKPWTGVNLRSADATEGEGSFIPVSDKAVKESKLCKDQKNQIKAIVNPLEPAESQPICSTNGTCYNGKLLVGRYDTWTPYQGIRLVNNSGNGRYPENAVTFKAEYHEAGHIGWDHGDDWGPTIVLRNITVEDPIALVQAHEGKIKEYLICLTNLKKGTPGTEGASCGEVVIARNGKIIKNESPKECRFK